MRALLVFVALTVACGPSTTAPTEATGSGSENGGPGAGAESGTGGTTGGTGGASESVPTYADGAACPEVYSTRAPSCTDAYAPSCVRADGAVCSCVEPIWCGGAAPPPMPSIWTCTIPVTCGPEGAPCSGPCPTAGCAWAGGMQCVGGVWVLVPPGPAPP